MKYKKLTGFLFFTTLFLMTGLAEVHAKEDAYLHQDKLREGSSMFFVVALKKGETLELSLKPYEDGQFYLFLFDERPSETYINPDKTLQDEIFYRDLAYDKGENPEITYKANKEQIYYIQAICIEGNYFQIESNKELTRFYIPRIDGYNPILFTCITLIFIGLMSLLLKRKISMRIIKKRQI